MNLLPGPAEKTSSHKTSICIYYMGRHRQDSYSSINWLAELLLLPLTGNGWCPASFGLMLWPWEHCGMLQSCVEKGTCQVLRVPRAEVSHTFRTDHRVTRVSAAPTSSLSDVQLSFLLCWAGCWLEQHARHLLRTARDPAQFNLTPSASIHLGAAINPEA